MEGKGTGRVSVVCHVLLTYCSAFHSCNSLLERFHSPHLVNLENLSRVTEVINRILNQACLTAESGIVTYNYNVPIKNMERKKKSLPHGPQVQLASSVSLRPSPGPTALAVWDVIFVFDSYNPRKAQKWTSGKITETLRNCKSKTKDKYGKETNLNAHYWYLYGRIKCNNELHNH